MILEGLVTTRCPDGKINLAPMGPRIELDDQGTPLFDRFLLRPFESSLTHANLLSERQGVLHVVDDVLLLARAAILDDVPLPPWRPASRIDGAVLVDCCRFYEFEIASSDTSFPRGQFQARVVHSGHVRDFFGLNRAKAAVVEAAILATRKHLFERGEIKEAFDRLAPAIEKTGGPNEAAAFEMLSRFVREGEAG